MIGKIFAIEEFATFDGPGIRMSVFLKGCPMRCEWCHNPEGQSPETEYKRNQNGCLACGACVGVGGGRLVEKSVEVCPRNLVKKCGEDISCDDLCKRIMKNADLLNATGGGVTFSGGEPLMQSDFVKECIDYLRPKVHCALQTSGCAAEETFQKVLACCNFVLYDLKLMDKNQHVRYCGVDNELILKNYETLASSGKDFVTRLPLIPGVTDTEDNITAVASFMQRLSVDKIELLPYNKLTGSKYSSLMRKYTPSFDGNIAPSPRVKIFTGRGIQVKVL